MASIPEYEAGGLYIILSALQGGGMHWSIFLMVSHPWGNNYNATDSSGIWELDYHMTENLIDSVSIIVAIQIARSINENRSDEVDRLLASVPVMREGGFVPRWGENFRCRVWAKDAIERLRLAGFVPDHADAQDYEDEAISIGRSNRARGMRNVILESRYL